MSSLDTQELVLTCPVQALDEQTFPEIYLRLWEIQLRRIDEIQPLPSQDHTCDKIKNFTNKKNPEETKETLASGRNEVPGGAL